MNYLQQINRPNNTPEDLKLIGWIAMTDKTLTADFLHTISRQLTNKMQELTTK